MTPSAAARVLLLALMVSAASCSADPPLDSDGSDGSLFLEERLNDVNVVLIVSDTMRRDRVGVYGGTAKTPTFDRFARSNIYFDQAFGQAPWTKPSVATLFTSLYPSQHGLASHPELRQRAGRDNSGELLGEVDVLGEGYTTLAEVLRGAGYNTAAFVSNPWMARPFGFDQGFDLYDDSFTGWDAPGQTISRKGLEWIENQRSGEKFFLYLHYMDSHRPYGKLNDTDVTELLQAPPTETDRLPSSEHRLYEWLIRHEQQDLSMTMVDQLVAADPTIRLIELAYRILQNRNY